MITLSISKSGYTPERIRELVKNLAILKNVSQKEIIDLSEIRWVTPLSILPVALLIARWQKRGIKVNLPTDPSINSYLNTILFPKGTDQPEVIPMGESYFPIVRISTEGKEFLSGVIDKTIGKYQELLSSLLVSQIYKKDITQALGWFIMEMAANVQDHAFAREFWLLSQYWQKSGEVEICLLDDGIGFSGSYNKAKIPIKDDIEAIDKAVKGISSKKDVGQGYGINRSIYLITESDLKGEFLIISGNAGYYKKHRQLPNLFKLGGIGWRGVVIMVKVQKPYSPINIYEYIGSR